jgi:hypothetical protein
MAEQDDVLLLQDDLDTFSSLNDNSGYDIHQLFDDDQFCTDSGKKDDSRKTRASVNKPDSESVNNSGRIIKGTAITSKKKLIKGKVLSLTLLTRQLKWLNFNTYQNKFLS